MLKPKQICIIMILLLLTTYSSHAKQNHLTNSHEQEKIETKAVYVGLIDSHSMEVLINGKPYAIQINPEQRKLIEPLKTGKTIKITYYYNVVTTQYLLVSIEPL